MYMYVSTEDTANGFGQLGLDLAMCGFFYHMDYGVYAVPQL